jgi:uncharacterized protein DUF1877
MACLGVHFVLTDADVIALRDLENDEARLAYVQDVIEERELSGPGAAESDKAWDAMHRALADGKLSLDGGDYPFSHVVLGGELLYDGADFLMSLKTPGEVVDIANALRGLSEQDFRARYDGIDSDYDGELGEDDFAYTWDWFQGVRDLYLRAAEQRRYVLFTADQ